MHSAFSATNYICYTAKLLAFICGLRLCAPRAERDNWGTIKYFNIICGMICKSSQLEAVVEMQITMGNGNLIVHGRKVQELRVPSAFDEKTVYGDCPAFFQTIILISFCHFLFTAQESKM